MLSSFPRCGWWWWVWELIVTLKIELELIQSHMAQKPVLGVKWGARVLRVRSVSREEVWASAGVQGAWVGGCGCEADEDFALRASIIIVEIRCRLVAAWRAATPLLVKGLLGLLGSPLEPPRVECWA